MNILRKTAQSAIALAALSCVAATSAQAEGRNREYMTGYIGYFDVIGADNSATQFGMEYRAAPLQFGIRPTIGVNVSTDESIYGYAGIHWDAALIENQLYLIPSFVAGAYKEGDGKDLGGAIEFTSGIELAYQFENDHRVGVAFNHISNASLYRKNPGAETAMVTYSIPVSIFK